MAEEPPYLLVDTDVSAKYKGAFCEAKIRKVVRSVKCKVLYKQGWGSATVPDDQVRGTLRVGAVVEAKHPDRKEFAEATITKIQDCSQYTVVFDDGDITTLRRTALCLKSGRHFAESDTLDQLPLTHPEHFSNPVIGGRRGRRRLDENSEDEELLLMSGAELEDEREEHIGRVVCVEGAEKKKQKDNWFPGLVVAPTAQDNVPIHVKEEYLVRSFKDGRYYTVPKKEAHEFTREVGARAEHPNLKAAVEKAILFLDRDELPPHWDRDLLLYGLGDVNSTDNDGGLDYESSDDEPREEKDHFVAQLYKFMDDSGTPINNGPTIGTRDVDLYKLFKVVQNQGGYNRVTNHNNWKLVAQKMGFGQNPVTVNLVKIAYKKFLFTFEEFYRKLGCTLNTHPPSRLSRSCCRGGRNLIRNKDQAALSSSVTNKNDIKPRQIKDGKVTSTEITVPVQKIKVEREEIALSPQEEEVIEDFPVELTKSPVPFQQRDRPKRAHNPSLQSAPSKILMPIKIKIERGTSPTATPSFTNLTQTCSNYPQFSRSQASVSPPPSKSHSTNSSPQAAFISIDPPVLQSTSQAPSILTPKKEPKARQIRKQLPSEIIPNPSSVVVDTPSVELSTSNPVPQAKEIKRRAAFPRAVVAAKKAKQQQSSRAAPPQSVNQPPGLAASRSKRAVKLKNIVKNLKNKWVTTSSLPPASNQEQPSARVNVKSKTKEDAVTGVKNKKDDSQTFNSPVSEDKKKSASKRRKDKRLSEDRFVTVPSYKTIVVGDKLRVYYGPTLESKVTYEAKVLSIRTEGIESHYLVHYTGWNNRYDEWIKTSRIADNLSWVPGRTARKNNQPPKPSKKKGGYSCKAEPSSKDASLPTSSISSNINTITNVPNKTPAVQLLGSTTGRKASTRASTRAAANKKETSNDLRQPDYESDSADTEPVAIKIKTDPDQLKLNNSSDGKRKKKRKFEPVVVKEEVQEEVTIVKMEVEEYEDEVENEVDGETGDSTADNFDENAIDQEKFLKKEMCADERNVSSEDLGNVIIVNVELKNESEEESLMIDESNEASGLNAAEVIEGYSTVIDSENNFDDKFKVLANQTGRDFDLSQIRSELKGIESNLSRSDDADDDDDDVENSVDIYEFKEPEFESDGNDKKDKQRRAGIAVRIFADVDSKESGDESEPKTNDTYPISAPVCTSDHLVDERPILKTCEEAFDRVCAEPLRAATERPPAGFLYIDDDDEDDFYADDDSQGRLIIEDRITERESDNEISTDVSIHLNPSNEDQPISNAEEITHAKPSLEEECDQEVLLNKEDEDEDLEDELLNVAIQRAIESSDDDTSDSDILSRHLAPRRMFADNFSPAIDLDSKSLVENDTINKLAVVSPDRTETSTLLKEDSNNEKVGVFRDSSLELSQGNEDYEDTDEVFTIQNGEVICEDELVSQDDTEQETVLETDDVVDANAAMDTDDVNEVDDDDFIPVEEAPASPTTVVLSRGPHTPPGPEPQTPPEPEDEYPETFEEEYEEVGAEEIERDEPPPLLTREVEVEECDERQEEIGGNDDDNDETNLVSLLCEETIPGSPTVAIPTGSYQLSPEENGEETFQFEEITPKCDNEPTSEKFVSQQNPESAVEFKPEDCPGPSSLPEVMKISSSYILLQPNSNHILIASPTSSLSSAASPSREPVESPPHEEVVDLHRPSTSRQNEDQYSDNFPNAQQSMEPTKPAVNEPNRPRKAETRSSGKKSRRSRKRSEDASKRKNRGKCRGMGSESDDNCETSRGYQRRSKTPPRLKKYNFNVHLTSDLDSQQRINKILHSISDLRKAYGNLKVEVSSIERRKKKLRRREREFRL